MEFGYCGIPSLALLIVLNCGFGQYYSGQFAESLSLNVVCIGTAVRAKRRVLYAQDFIEDLNYGCVWVVDYLITLLL